MGESLTFHLSACRAEIEMWPEDPFGGSPAKCFPRQFNPTSHGGVCFSSFFFSLTRCQAPHSVTRIQAQQESLQLTYDLALRNFHSFAVYGMFTPCLDIMPGCSEGAMEMYHGKKKKKHRNRYSDTIVSRSISFFLRKSGSANGGKICLLGAMVATPAMVLPPIVLAVCGKQWCENLKQETPEVNRWSLQILHFSKCVTKFCVTSVHPASMRIIQLSKCLTCIILLSVTQVLVLSTVWEISCG